MLNGLSMEQARALRNKVCFGDFREHRWPTIKALFDKGMIQEIDKGIVATPKGKTYVDENHLRIR